VRISLAVGLAVLGCVLAACGGGEPPAPGTARLETPAGVVRLDVEVARSRSARERGLIGRTAVPPGTGMAFVHEDAVASRGLWMRGMTIPLSAAFARGDGTIVAILDMEPCSEDPCPIYRPLAPWVVALEVGHGEFERLGVRVGDRLEITSR
jgi:uncharacterized membrane protein (UPF0127 family)